MISFIVKYRESSNVPITAKALNVLGVEYPNGSTCNILANGDIVGSGTLNKGIWYLESSVDIPKSKVPSNSRISRDVQDISALKKGNRIVVIGSSITQHGNVVTSTKIATDSRGYQFWLNALLNGAATMEQWYYDAPDGKRYSVGANRGVSGQYSDAIYNRKEDIAAMGADIYIIQQGTNDLAGLPIQDTINNCINLAKYLRDLGAWVVLVGEPPRSFSAGTGWESGGVAQKKRCALNNAKANLAAKEKGILYVNPDTLMTTTTGEALSTVLYDGTHTSSIGGYLLAKSIYDVICPTLVPKTIFNINPQNIWDATNNPNSGLVNNPTFAANGSGWTQSIIGGLTVTKTTQSDGSLKITVVNDGTGTPGTIASVALLQDSLVGLANIGEYYRCDCVINSNNSVGLYGVKTYIRGSKAGETSVYVFGGDKYLTSTYPNSKTSYWPNFTTPILNRSPILRVPYNGASIKIGIYLEFNAGVAGTSDIYIQGCTAYKTESPWAIMGVSIDTGYSSQNYDGSSEN